MSRRHIDQRLNLRPRIRRRTSRRSLRRSLRRQRIHAGLIDPRNLGLQLRAYRLGPVCHDLANAGFHNEDALLDFARPCRRLAGGLRSTICIRRRSLHPAHHRRVVVHMSLN